MDLPLTKIKVAVVPKFFMYVSTKYKTSFFLYIIKDVNYLHFLYVNHIFKIIAVPNVSIYLLTIPDALDYFSLSYRIILHQTCCET